MTIHDDDHWEIGVFYVQKNTTAKIRRDCDYHIPHSMMIEQKCGPVRIRIKEVFCVNKKSLDHILQPSVIKVFNDESKSVGFLRFGACLLFRRLN